jgi:hypothetical protein
MVSRTPGGREAAHDPGKSISDDYLLASYITYRPTPYDAGITDDPEAQWDEIGPEPGPEAEAL